MSQTPKTPMSQNRYTGAFMIAASPVHPDGKIAMIRLRTPQHHIEQDEAGRPILATIKTHDGFHLSPAFKESDAGFKRQLMQDLNGISEFDADTIVRARNALRDALDYHG